MKAGEMLTCPHCGEKTVVKLRRVMDGWQVTGEELICTLCSAVLGKPEKDGPGTSAARSRLAALLGGDDTKGVTLAPESGYRRGCRNCANLLEHPFKLICAKTQLEVDPMHECGDFIDRMKEEK